MREQTVCVRGLGKTGMGANCISPVDCAPGRAAKGANPFLCATDGGGRLPAAVRVMADELCRIAGRENNACDL